VPGQGACLLSVPPYQVRTCHRPRQVHSGDTPDRRGALPERASSQPPEPPAQPESFRRGASRVKFWKNAGEAGVFGGCDKAQGSGLGPACPLSGVSRVCEMPLGFPRRPRGRRAETSILPRLPASAGALRRPRSSLPTMGRYGWRCVKEKPTLGSSFHALLPAAPVILFLTPSAP
jgi:hypothetical protein